MMTTKVEGKRSVDVLVPSAVDEAAEDVAVVVPQRLLPNKKRQMKQ
jgi:hypothetical protein